MANVIEENECGKDLEDIFQLIEDGFLENNDLFDQEVNLAALHEGRAEGGRTDHHHRALQRGLCGNQVGYSSQKLVTY